MAFFQCADVYLPQGAAVGLPDGGTAVGVPEGRVPDGTTVGVPEVAAAGVPEGVAVGVPEGAAVGDMPAEIDISHQISGRMAVEEDVKDPVGNDMFAKIDYEGNNGDDDIDHVENDHYGEGLSWYESLRLSNISWNEERLKMLGLNTKEYSSAAEFTKKKKQPSIVLKTVPVPGSLSTCRSVRIQINETEKNTIAPSTSKGGVPCTSLLVKRSELKDQTNPVIVNYKGMGVLVKATILNHCEKVGMQDYKIHYDEKENTFHWIQVDQVTKYLMDDDDEDSSCCGDEWSGSDDDKHDRCWKWRRITTIVLQLAPLFLIWTRT
jgi:hypothetical protein